MNNFDQSSSGVNLELNVCWDNDLSRIDFEENFKVTQYSSYRQNSILLYTWTGEVDHSDFELYDPANFDINVTGKQLLRLFYNHIGGDYKELLQDYCNWYSMQDLTVDSVLSFIYDYYQSSVDQCEFLEEHFNKNYQVLISRGYCQGDYSEVIFTKELITKIRSELTNCKDKTDEEIAEYFQDDIDNLLWYSPLYARLEVDDQEIYLNDFQESRYKYDKDKTLEYCKKVIDHPEKEYILEWLDENLPDQPDYN